MQETLYKKLRPWISWFVWDLCLFFLRLSLENLRKSIPWTKLTHLSSYCEAVCKTNEQVYKISMNLMDIKPPRVSTSERLVGPFQPLSPIEIRLSTRTHTYVLITHISDVNNMYRIKQLRNTCKAYKECRTNSKQYKIYTDLVWTIETSYYRHLYEILSVSAPSPRPRSQLPF